MTRTRRLTRALRRDEGATDPILVIAAIAVSLILLIGGSFSVSSMVSHGRDLNAKADLDHIATAETAVYASGDAYANYKVAADGVRSGDDIDPSKPGIQLLDHAAIGFTPTDKTPGLEADVCGQGWIAASHSVSGNVYLRTSESAQILTAPASDAKLPQGCDPTNLDQIIAGVGGTDNGTPPSNGGSSNGTTPDAGSGAPVVDGGYGFDAKGNPYGAEATGGFYESDADAQVFYVGWAPDSNTVGMPVDSYMNKVLPFIGETGELFADDPNRPSQTVRVSAIIDGSSYDLGNAELDWSVGGYGDATSHPSVTLFWDDPSSSGITASLAQQLLAQASFQFKVGTGRVNTLYAHGLAADGSGSTAGTMNWPVNTLTSSQAYASFTQVNVVYEGVTGMNVGIYSDSASVSLPHGLAENQNYEMTNVQLHLSDGRTISVPNPNHLKSSFFHNAGHPEWFLWVPYFSRINGPTATSLQEALTLRNATITFDANGGSYSVVLPDYQNWIAQ